MQLKFHNYLIIISLFTNDNTRRCQHSTVLEKRFMQIGGSIIYKIAIL